MLQLMGVCCPQVNNHLSSRTYLIGQHLTMADLLVCGAVYPAVVRVGEAGQNASSVGVSDWERWRGVRYPSL